MSSFVVVDDALPTRSKALGTGTGADILTIDAIRDDILASKTGKFSSNADEKTIKVGYEDISLSVDVFGSSRSHLAEQPTQQNAKAKPLGLFKKKQHSTGAPSFDASNSTKTADSVPSSPIKVKMSMVLQTIKDSIMKNSSSLHISSIDTNKNVRVFPRIYDNGGYRAFSQIFPSVEDDARSAQLAPNETKVYFELFLNEEGDDWSDEDGGQALLRYLDPKSEVVSVSPKRNRLLLVTLANSRLQAVNEVVSTEKLRISLSGCFFCKIGSQAVGGVASGGISKRSSLALGVMAESKLIPRFYFSNRGKKSDGEVSKSKRKRDVASNVRFWSSMCRLNSVQNIKLLENSSLYITQISLNIGEGGEKVYTKNKKKSFSVRVTATDATNEFVTILNHQLQFQQSEVIAFNESKISTSLPTASQLDYDNIEIRVQSADSSSNMNSNSNSSTKSSKNKNNNSNDDVDDDIFVTLLGFYHVSSSSKSLRSDSARVMKGEYSNDDNNDDDDDDDDDDDEEDDDDDVDPEEYMQMIMTEMADLNGKKEVGSTSKAGGRGGAENRSNNGDEVDSGSGDDQEDDEVTLKNLEIDSLNSQDVEFLSQFINPKYLDMEKISKFQTKFCKNSVLELNQFFCNPIVDKIQVLLSGAGVKSTRIGDKDESRSAWESIFDDNNSFSVYNPSIKDKDKKFKETSSDEVGGLLSKLSGTLLTSKPFAKWLFAMTNVLPVALSSSVRRFKGGDYMLCQSQVNTTRNFNNNRKALCIDACFLKERDSIRKYRKLRGIVGTGDSIDDKKDDIDIDGKSKDEGWIDGTYGGYQSYIDVVSSMATKRPGGGGEEVDGGGGDDSDEDGKAYDEDGFDSAELLSCPAGFNKFYLVLQDEGVLNYLKYMSHTAASDRFDISGVYEFFYVGKEGDDEDDEEDDDASNSEEDDDDDDDDGDENDE